MYTVQTFLNTTGYVTEYHMGCFVVFVVHSLKTLNRLLTSTELETNLFHL